MKNLIILKSLALITLLMFASSCTQNQRAKNFGGKAEVTLPKGKKLIITTWKDDNLWYLTRDMNPEDSAEVYQFSEESSFGVWEGTYIIKEQKLEK